MCIQKMNNTHPTCHLPTINNNMCDAWHGVATIRRLLKNTDLVCRISSLLQGSFAKETCNFKEPTNRSHPISWSHGDRLSQHWVARDRRVASQMGRLWLVGSLKLQVSFAEEPYKRDDIPSITMGWLQFIGSLKFKVSFAKEPYKRDDIHSARDRWGASVCDIDRLSQHWVARDMGW